MCPYLSKTWAKIKAIVSSKSMVSWEHLSWCYQMAKNRTIASSTASKGREDGVGPHLYLQVSTVILKDSMDLVICKTFYLNNTFIMHRMQLGRQQVFCSTWQWLGMIACIYCCPLDDGCNAGQLPVCSERNSQHILDQNSICCRQNRASQPCSGHWMIPFQFPHGDVMKPVPLQITMC